MVHYLHNHLINLIHHLRYHWCLVSLHKITLKDEKSRFNSFNFAFSMARYCIFLAIAFQKNNHFFISLSFYLLLRFVIYQNFFIFNFLFKDHEFSFFLDYLNLDRDLLLSLLFLKTFHASFLIFKIRFQRISNWIFLN